MKIYDENDNLVENPDLDVGYVRPDKRLIAHHPAVEAVDEVWHYEYTPYPNGGRDAVRVVDVPGVQAQEAWDEYEDILRYVKYTEDELAAQEEARKQSAVYRVAVLEDYISGMETAYREGVNSV